MELNIMPGIIVYDSKDERGEMSGDVNRLQAKDSCLFCKKTGHHKINCQCYKDWKKKNPNRKTGNTNRKLVSCYKTGKEGQISHDCRSERQDSGWRDEQQNQGGKQMAVMAEVAKFMTDIEEEAEKWRKWCERQNSGPRDEQQNQGGGNGGIQNGYLRGDQEDSMRYGFFDEGFQ